MPPQTALKCDKKLAFASLSPYLLNMPVPITIIGLGSVGQALARAFHRARLGELALIGRGRPGERTLARALKARYLPDLHGLRQDRGFIIICVKDNQIATIARHLARLKLDWKRITTLHTSGVWGSDMLKPLAFKGAAVAAWHPFMTFPKTSARRAGSVEYQFRRAGSGDSSSRRAGSPTLPESALFRGVTFGVSGEPRAVRAANRLTRSLGGRPLRLREEDRVLYHLSAVLACGFVAANLDMAVRVLKKIGLSEKRALETVLPIASQTLKNVTALGTSRALTGPAVRGDHETIRKHLRALRKLDPELARLYATVSRHLLKRV
jgi:predicted short-subunit dehydrogenase-like oxidoreductase (DUF2520 family)